MPIDLIAQRLVWCREPAPPQDLEAAALRPGRPQARASPLAQAPFNAPLTAFGAALDPAGLAALAEAALAAIGCRLARLLHRREARRTR